MNTVENKHVDEEQPLIETEETAKPEWQTPTISCLTLGAATLSGCLCGFESCAGFILS